LIRRQNKGALLLFCALFIAWWCLFFYLRDSVAFVAPSVLGAVCFLTVLTGVLVLSLPKESGTEASPVDGRSVALFLKVAVFLGVAFYAFSSPTEGGGRSIPGVEFFTLFLSVGMGAIIWACVLTFFPVHHPIRFLSSKILGIYVEQAVIQQMGVWIIMQAVVLILLLQQNMHQEGLSRGVLWLLLFYWFFYTRKRSLRMLKKGAKQGKTWQRWLILRVVEIAFLVVGGSALFPNMSPPFVSVDDGQWGFILMALLMIPFVGKELLQIYASPKRILSRGLGLCLLMALCFYGLKDLLRLAIDHRIGQWMLWGIGAVLWGQLLGRHSRVQDMAWGERGRYWVGTRRYLPVILIGLIGMLLFYGSFGTVALLIYGVPFAGMGFWFLFGAVFFMGRSMMGQKNRLH
jgi:hypothetical protein